MCLAYRRFRSSLLEWVKMIKYHIGELEVNLKLFRHNIYQFTMIFHFCKTIIIKGRIWTLDFWCVLNVVAVLLVLDRRAEDLSDGGGADVVAADADESQGDRYEGDVATMAFWTKAILIYDITLSSFFRLEPTLFELEHV